MKQCPTQRCFLEWGFSGLEQKTLSESRSAYFNEAMSITKRYFTSFFNMRS